MNRIVLRPIERFRHDPLQSPDRQIRLLSILPSPEGAVAQYSIQTYILGDPKCPYFHALSYEWGSDQPSSDIAINGNLFKVRSNLKDFLELLRSSSEDFIRPVWIDAICIDQTSTPERNAQVKIMGQIFQSAKLVMTWLGRQDFVDGRLMEAAVMLREWETRRDYRRLTRPSSFDDVAAVSQAITPPLLGTAAEYVDMWSCLRLLCQQSFWTRCWIVQEQIKAQKLLLLWGYQQISWSTLAIAFRTIHAYTTSRPEAMQRTAPWTPILSSIPYQVWLHVEGLVRDHPLLELMETYHSSSCSVTHDKAYALTGISSDAELLQVDYDKSLPDLYVNLMQLMTETRECLKYSRLVLEALELSPPTLATDSTLRGHHIVCDAHFVSDVALVKRLQSPEDVVILETAIVQLLMHVGTIPLSDELEQIAGWAKLAQQAFRRKDGSDTILTFFCLSDGHIGVSQAFIMAGDCIYSVPSTVGGAEKVYVRAESSQESAKDDESIYTSPTSPSLSSPTSTSFSETSMSPIVRVWLLDRTRSRTLQRETQIMIPFPDLVALDPSLNIEITQPSPSPKQSKRRTSRVPSVTTHHGAYSDPVGGAIDAALRSPKLKQAERASTWPIDALAREMREKMALDTTSPLNSPD